MMDTERYNLQRNHITIYSVYCQEKRYLKSEKRPNFIAIRFRKSGLSYQGESAQAD